MPTFGRRIFKYCILKLKNMLKINDRQKDHIRKRKRKEKKKRKKEKHGKLKKLERFANTLLPVNLK